MRTNRLFGGRPMGQMRIGPGAPPPFIKWMLIANGAVFLLQFAFGGRLEPVLGLTPARFFSDFPNLLYQLVSYMFVHSTAYFSHLLFNMFALWMFGTEIESSWGSKAFGRFYLLAGLSGGLLTLVVYPSQVIPVIGASAAIYGLLVAYWLMFPQRQLYIYFLFPVKVKYAIPGVMLLGFLFSGANVAHMAHLGGALFGLVYLKSEWRGWRVKNWFGRMKRERQETKLRQNRQKAVDVMNRVDSILDKINEVGIENISREDRDFLEDASARLSEKNQQPGKNG